MTDKQPEALELASVAESADLVGYPTAKKANAYYLCLLEDCADVIRKLHAENETLTLYKSLADEYGLSIFKDLKDLGDAGSDVQLLRMGYAAARLEIESLRKEHADELAVAYMCGASREKELAAQQPGAAYATLPEPITYQIAVLKACEHGDALVGWRVEPSRQSFDASMRPKRKLYTEGDMHDFADRTHALRAPHGQASAQADPADIIAGALQISRGHAYDLMRDAVEQAAPAAVAGPWSLGEIEGYWRDIDHKSHQGVIRIVWKMEGDERTPDCEARALAVVDALNAAAPTTKPAPQQGEGRNLQAVINAAADKLDAAKRCHQSAVDTLIDEALEILDGDRDPHKPAPQQEAQEPILYDPKALLEVFQNAQAGSSCPAGTLRGIAAVIASWESREPHTLIAAPQPSPAAQGDALDAPVEAAVQQDAGRWRRLVNASELSFPVATIADDPENGAVMLYGRKALEDFVDRMDEIPNTYDAARAAQEGK